MSLATAPQIRWQPISVLDGGSFDIRINRPGASQTVYDPAGTIIFTSNGGPSILNEIKLSQKYATSEGRKAVDNISIEFNDRTDYSGTVAGVPVTEDFGASLTTFLDVWFDANGATDDPYWVWVTWYDAAGNPDGCFQGQYYAVVKPQQQYFVNHPHTSTEEIRSVRTVQVTALAEILKNTTFAELLPGGSHPITQLDCQIGQFYNGFVTVNPISVIGGFAGQVFTAGGTSLNLIHAAPYVQDWRGFINNVVSMTGFPSGLWGISIGRLLTKMMAVVGVDFTPSADMDSAFDFYRQTVDNTNKCFPVDTSAPIALDSIYINYNAYFGFHPIDGSECDTQVSFKSTQSFSEILSAICNFLCCDWYLEIDATGTSRLKLKALGDTNGTLPTAWTPVGDFAEVEPTSGPVKVSVNHRADSLKILAPSNAVGDSVEKEIPFRLRYWANTFDVSPTGEENLLKFGSILWDGTDPVVQADTCFKAGFTDESAVTTIFPDFWKGVASIYYYYDGVGNINQAYPSTWSPFDSSNWAGFYALGCEVPKGVVPSATQHPKYFSSLNYQSVVFARYLIPSETSLTRSYSGITGADGKISSVQLGFTSTWLYGGNASFTAQAIELVRGLNNSISEVKWQEIPTGGFPGINDITYAADSTTGGTTTSSSSGTTGSAGAIPPGSFPSPLYKNPTTTAINTLTPTDAAVVGLTHKAIAGQTANTEEWQTSLGGVVASMAANGNFTAQTLTGTSLTLTLKASSAATVGGDGSTTLTTKGYVDALVAAVPVVTNYVKTNPATSQTVTPTGGSATSVVPLIIDGVSGQLANLQQWKTDAVLQTYIDPAGNVVTVGKMTSAATAAGDASTILTTKGWTVPRTPDLANSPIVQPGDSSTAALILKQYTSGTSDVFSVTDSALTYYFKINYLGVPSFAKRIDAVLGLGINGATGGSSLDVNGSFGTAPITKTASYTLTANDHTVWADGTGGAFPIILPTASGATGREYCIKRISAGANNITVSGTIDGVVNKVLTAQYQSVRVKSNGTSWYFV
jgi:hypothetical protein